MIESILGAPISPGVVALSSFEHGDITYGALDRAACDIARAVRSSSGGDTVTAVDTSDPTTTIAALLGCVGLGPVTLLPPTDGPEWLGRHIADVGASCIVHGSHSKHLADLGASTDNATVEVEWTSSGLEARAHTRRRSPAVPQPAGLRTRTSGTTGPPKLIDLRLAWLVDAARRVAATLRLGPSDTSLNVLRLDHTHGLVTNALAPLVSGGRAILLPEFAPDPFLEACCSLRPTWCSAVPVVHRQVLQLRGRGLLEQVPFRFVRSASAPLGADTAARLEEQLGVPVVEAYALTEAPGEVVSGDLPPAERRLGSVGRLRDGHIHVGAPPDGRHPQQRSVSGEIHVRVPELAARGGPWLATGDIGDVDEDGFLYVRGRTSDAINRGGRKLWPADVERVVRAHANGVLDVAVCAVPHPTLGEIAVCAVVPSTSLDTRALRQLVRSRCHPDDTPDRFVTVANVPYTLRGKVDRTALRRLVMTALATRKKGAQHGTT